MKSILILVIALVYSFSVSNVFGSVSDKGKVIVLSATSSLEKFPVKNVMDGNDSTYWQASGDCKDEGILIQFLEPTKLKSLKILSDDAKDLMIYINGLYYGSFKPNQTVLIDTSEATALYIKIQSEKPVKIKELKINESSKDGTETVKPLSFIKGTISASSILDPKVSYAPEQLFDGKLDFGWSEGSSGNGENETLTMDFPKEILMDSLNIANGYQRSKEHFTANTRAKEIELTANGKILGSFILEDRMGFQKVDFKSEVKVKQLKMTVKTVYKGTKYTDLVLSEMKFSSKGKLIDMETDFMNQCIVNNTKALKSTIMEGILGKYLRFFYHSNQSKDRIQTDISMKLRANGSFVVWYSTIDMQDNKEINNEKVMEGNWVLIKAAKDKAEVKIFGKMHTTSIKNNYSDPYSNPEYVDNIKIFSDNLTIKPAAASDFKEESLMVQDMISYIQGNEENPPYFISGKTIFGVFPAFIDK